MGKLITKMKNRVFAKKKGLTYGGYRGGSENVTGIDSGDPGSNTGGGERDRRRPGRRNAQTPLGPGRNRM